MNEIFKKILIKIKNIRTQLSSEKGFTLIEIMVVLAIMAIMYALLSSNIFQKPQQARVEGAKIKMQQLGIPLLQYSQTKGNFPSTEEGLEALITEGMAKKKDILDPWNNPYGYRYPGEHAEGEYDLWSYGADGKEGGEGVNADINNWE